MRRLTSNKHASVALTIAGSDSGGGAGIQADLKTFAALGVHGTSVITCLTAQNPSRVIGVMPVSREMIRKQLAAVFEELPAGAIKTGMLYSAEIICEIAAFLRKLSRPPTIVVDPVIVATSGARLLQQSAVQALMSKLLPRADVVTPNVPEAEALTGLTIREPEDMRAAARALHGKYGCAVVVKGGHLRGTKQAIDIFIDDKIELMLEAPTIYGVKLHGTGCTYSAAIAAWSARGCRLPEAAQRAKDFITQAIYNRVQVGRHQALWP